MARAPAGWGRCGVGAWAAVGMVFIFGGVGRTKRRPWVMRRTPRSLGYWRTFFCLGRGRGGHWSSENSPPARFGPGLSSPTTGCAIAGATGGGSLRPMCLPPPKPRRAEGGDRVQAKDTRRKQVRPTDPLGGRGKRKEAYEKLVTSEATTTSGEESSISVESPPGGAVAPAGLGEGGGRTAETICVSSASDGEQGGELGAGGGGNLSSGPDPGRVSAGPDPLRSGVARSGRLGEDLWLRPGVRDGRGRRVRRWEWEIVGEGKGALEGGLLVAKGMRQGPGCRLEAEV